jgi:NTP pyrophosphatase (non-canonical NTP hydrolase)
MKKALFDAVLTEEERGKVNWGHVDKTPVDLLAAATEELGEVAHAVNHNEGAAKVKQEIAETMGILSRLYDMVD